MEAFLGLELKGATEQLGAGPFSFGHLSCPRKGWFGGGVPGGVTLAVKTQQ